MDEKGDELDVLRSKLNQYLIKNPNWLIVLDGAVDDSVLGEFLSNEALAKGTVIVTSTWRWWKSDRIASVTVLPFSKSASLDFIKTQLEQVGFSTIALSENKKQETQPCH